MDINEQKNPTLAKTKYHHGDLREALIAAVRQLVFEKGVDNFSLADACRLAGVSTAAPYRHFQDKDEILRLIVLEAYDELLKACEKAIEKAGTGTEEAMIALGQTYVRFAIEQEALFRLMFGFIPPIRTDVVVEERGRSCFEYALREITVYCKANNIKEDPLKISLRTWTFVHGAASLLLEEDYQRLYPEINLECIEKIIAETAPLLLRGKS